MAVQWSTPELADRFARYVEELQDFLVGSHLHYGSANDIALLAARIDDDPSFRDGLASLVRAIILRQGGVIPRAQLLEIVAVAVGGHELDQPNPELQQSLHRLLVFLNTVAAKPWNQLPGEARLKQERLPGVVCKMPAAVAAPQAEVPPQELVSALDGGGEPPIQQADVPFAPVAASAESPEDIRGESYASMLAARHKVVPITARKETPPPDGSEAMPLASRHPAAVAAAPMAAAMSAPYPQSSGVFSRLSHVEREADAAPGPNPAPIPSPVPSPIPPPPPPTLVSEAVHDSVSLREPDQGESWRMPLGEPAADIPAAAAAIPQPTEIDEHLPLATPLPPAPQPHVAFMHLPGVAAVESFFAGLSVRKLPRVSVPDLSLPKLKMPHFTMPKLPAFSLPRPRFESVSLSRLPPVPLFVGVLAGAVVVVFAAERLLIPHSSSSGPAAGVVQRASPVGGATATASAAVAAPLPAPAAVAPVKPSPYGSPHYDNYVAPPYSRTASGGPAAVQSSAAPPAPGPNTAARPAETASVQPGGLGGPAPVGRPARTFNPDATFVGASADEAVVPPPARRRTMNVSSGVMRGNLLSAPTPGYPLLAKLTHTQGQVVVQAVVARDGTVTDARALRGHHLLRGAAEDAVRRWRYRPYLIDGRPAEVSTIVTLNFPSRTR